MNIEDKRQSETTCFGDLNVGDCFVCRGDVYIKVGLAGEMKNAFNLTSNILIGFMYPSKVAKVDAKVVIE